MRRGILPGWKTGKSNRHSDAGSGNTPEHSNAERSEREELISVSTEVGQREASRPARDGPPEDSGPILTNTRLGYVKPRSQRWVGVDLDGTLAQYPSGGFKDRMKIGDPILPMVLRVKAWLDKGINVKIVTARIANRQADSDYPELIANIQDWCLTHIGQYLDITCQKDYLMIELWDDSVVAVEKNTGRVLSPSRLANENV